MTLSDVTVTDPLSPDCDRNLGTLAVGQSKSYTCTRKNVTADFENVATATGKPPTGATVKASDHANIKVAGVRPAAAPEDRDRQEPEAPDADDAAQDDEDAERRDEDRPSPTARRTSRSRSRTPATSTLHNVKVSDPPSPGCNKSLGTLAAGQVEELQLRRAPTVTARLHATSRPRPASRPRA